MLNLVRKSYCRRQRRAAGHPVKLATVTLPWPQHPHQDGLQRALSSWRRILSPSFLITHQTWSDRSLGLIPVSALSSRQQSTVAQAEPRPHPDELAETSLQIPQRCGSSGRVGPHPGLAWLVPWAVSELILHNLSSRRSAHRRCQWLRLAKTSTF